MAVTLQVVENNGATRTETVITTTRLCLADTPSPGTSNPCVKPVSGLNYSFWKDHRLRISGTFTQVGNIRWYSSGSPSWSLGLNGKVIVARRDAGDHGCPIANYQQAAGAGNSGYYIKDATNGHAYYRTQTVAPADVGTYTAGAPLVLDTTNYTAAATSKGAILQVQIDTDAVSGQRPATTFYFVVDVI